MSTMVAQTKPSPTAMSHPWPGMPAPMVATTRLALMRETVPSP
jgi:hypothetical protein